MTHGGLCCVCRLNKQNQLFVKVRAQQRLLCKLCHAIQSKEHSSVVFDYLPFLFFLFLSFLHKQIGCELFKLKLRILIFVLAAILLTQITATCWMQPVGPVRNLTSAVPVLLVLLSVWSQTQRLHLCCVCVYTNGDPRVQTLGLANRGFHWFGQQY